MKKQHFLQGAAILAAAGVISKLLGAVYRIPFARMVGGEGMGLYQMAYPIYTLALALSTSGLPVALAIMISERAARNEHTAAKKIFRVALLMLALLGTLMSLAIYKLAPWLSVNVFHHPSAFLAIQAVAPAILVSAVVSCWRGYFQGYQNMIPTAVSQIVEQIVRVATVLILAFYLIKHGVAYAAAGAAFGAVTGGCAAILALAIFWAIFPTHKASNPATPTALAIAKELFVLGIPVSLAGLIMPLVQGVDAAIIPGRLIVAGFSATEAAELYGQLTGMALTLVNLPVMLTVALAAGIVPAISEAFALKNQKLAQVTIKQAFMALFLVTLPSAIGLSVLSEQICGMLYKIPQAGVILKATAPIVFAIGFYQVTASILQGMGKMMVTLINFIIGCTIKISLTYLLVGIPSIGIIGAANATAGGFILAAALNTMVLFKHFSKKIFEFGLVRICLANLVLYQICQCAVRFFTPYGTNITVISVITLACLVYFGICLIFGIIKPEDLRQMLKRVWRKK